MDEVGCARKLPTPLTEATPVSDEVAPYVYSGVAEIEPTPLDEDTPPHTAFGVAAIVPTPLIEADARSSSEATTVAFENACAVPAGVSKFVAFAVTVATPVRDDDV
jgi:hypothetical protein